MKIKATLIIWLTAGTLLVNAQSLDISGQYESRGGTLYLMNNNTFFLIAYATFIPGLWRIDQSNLITLFPKNPEHSFVLFGRHNPGIKQGFKIMFLNFEEGQTLIGLGQSDTVQRVFNQDANCFKFPYVHWFNTQSSSITLGKNLSELFDSKNATSQIYTYEPNHSYNDFIAHYIQPDRVYKPMYLIATKDGVRFRDEKQVIPRMDIKPDELEELYKMEKTYNKIYFDTALYINPSYNFKMEINLPNYQFNEMKNAYTHKTNYIPDEELNKQTDAYNYNNPYILYKYDKIPVDRIGKREFQIKEKSLFEVKCK